jgi:hypothetical protein
VGFAECGDGVDAEVSGLRGGLYRDCYGCWGFGFGCGALAAVGVGALCGDAGLDGGEAFVEVGSGKIVSDELISTFGHMCKREKKAYLRG